MINLTNLIFYLILILSSLFSISSNSWFSCWMGMEINLFAFIPLLFFNNMNSESMIKYFIIQVMSSSLMLFSIFLIMNKMNMNLIIIIILNLSFFMKLGSAPFHYWYIQIIKSMNWKNCFILFTWQKIIPMILLNYNFNTFMFYFFISMNVLMGSLEGLNQISLRSIMNFSSINHLGWMFMIIYMNKNLWLIYFMSYSFMSLILILMFYMMNISFMNQIYYIKNNFMNTFNVIINLLSLGGLPPMMGFFPKWISIQYMIINKEFFISLLLTITSLITLYFYLRLTFSIMNLIYTKIKWIYLIKNNFLTITMFMFSFFSIMMLLIFSMIMF
uniref:NADH-ubiquinone oxidoreductase chain 2 n=1 Tax=Kisaura zhejiangensis (nom. nud.) TaxID=2904921 RepID=A0A9E8RT09_9NEOP|nr:NADH dehydrogenase subunit 2 [Kisaura zhejiangensis (nom. nud.)]UZZ44065.1 NADH dehydrogenase subunit 2 [Kisaura zhejiangensis (nom. nud.)]